jgi:polar amino acid transport system substrate-binding protein
MNTRSSTKMALNRLAGKIALGVVMALATAAGAEAADCPANLPVVSPGKISYVLNTSIPPTMYYKDGKLIGLNIELGDEVARRLCLDPVYIDSTFETQIAGLQSKRWDVLQGGVFYTEARTKIMQLVPYAVVAKDVTVTKGNPLGISKVEDLAGRAVGVEIGGAEEKDLRSISDQLVAKGQPAIKVQVFNAYADTFLALVAGQVNAVFASDVTSKYYADQGRLDVAVSGVSPGTAMALATIEPKLAQAVADALESMHKDGTYDRLMDKAGATKVYGWSNWNGHFAYYFKP